MTDTERIDILSKCYKIDVYEKNNGSSISIYSTSSLRDFCDGHWSKPKSIPDTIEDRVRRLEKIVSTLEGYTGY